ncbi:MAG: hypothetical protein ACUVQ2_04565 [Dissulfurimicrobium sp.]|uniref:hypothetical protein n=1 Tax=Dissulfurimicrobium sp. TaxID=2022436 RepID=UPI004049C733
MFDCEWRGKVDTEIAPTEISNVKAVLAVAKARPYCRINRFGFCTASEVEHAVSCGANAFFCP